MVFAWIGLRNCVCWEDQGFEGCSLIWTFYLRSMNHCHGPVILFILVKIAVIYYLFYSSWLIIDVFYIGKFIHFKLLIGLVNSLVKFINLLLVIVFYCMMLILSCLLLVSLVYWIKHVHIQIKASWIRRAKRQLTETRAVTNYPKCMIMSFVISIKEVDV